MSEQCGGDAPRAQPEPAEPGTRRSGDRHVAGHEHRLPQRAAGQARPQAAAAHIRECRRDVRQAEEQARQGDRARPGAVRPGAVRQPQSQQGRAVCEFLGRHAQAGDPGQFGGEGAAAGGRIGLFLAQEPPGGGHRGQRERGRRRAPARRHAEAYPGGEFPPAEPELRPAETGAAGKRQHGGGRAAADRCADRRAVHCRGRHLCRQRDRDGRLLRAAWRAHATGHAARCRPPPQAQRLARRPSPSADQTQPPAVVRTRHHPRRVTHRRGCGCSRACPPFAWGSGGRRAGPDVRAWCVPHKTDLYGQRRCDALTVLAEAGNTGDASGGMAAAPLSVTLRAPLRAERRHERVGRGFTEEDEQHT